jgi:hypothetical protein
MAALSGNFGGDGPPPGPDPRQAAEQEGFRRAVAALRAGAVRGEVEVEPIRAPARLAPYTFALSGAVSDGAEVPTEADGRLILLHDPDGHDAWQGNFRIVTLTQADLEQEMATDPLLPEVGWSWLTDALAERGASYTEPSGTISRSASHFFGGLARREPTTRIEIRASWTPTGEDLGRHLAAWSDLLCTAAGLPPARDGVVSMPRPARRPG